MAQRPVGLAAPLNTDKSRPGSQGAQPRAGPEGPESSSRFLCCALASGALGETFLPKDAAEVSPAVLV